MIKALVVFFVLVSTACKTLLLKDDLSGDQRSKITFRAVKKIDQAQLKNFIEKRQHRLDKKPNIYFIFVDTLRQDYATPGLMPHFTELKNESLTFKHAFSSSTVTHSSSFGLFYADHIFNRDVLLRNNWSLGSPFLQLLHRSGYRLYMYGSPWQFCINSSATYTSKKDLIESADSNLQSLYGLKTRDLVDFCYPNPGGKSLPQQEPKVVFDGRDENDKTIYHQAYRDHAVTSDLIAKVEASPRNGQMFLVFYSGVHDPYSWLEFGYPRQGTEHLGPLKDLYQVFTPNFPWNPNWYAYRPDNPSPEFATRIKNSYKNAVSAVDYQIARLISHLKAKGNYDDALIVVVSDHGEFLYDKGQFPEGNDNRIGHCCGLYNATTEIPEIIKFPQGQFAGELPIGDHLTIFPSIFDYLGYDNYEEFSKLISGKSSLSSLSTCAVSFDPRGDPPGVFYVVDSESGERVFFSVAWNLPAQLRAQAIKPLYILAADGSLKHDLRKSSSELAWQIIQRSSYAPCMDSLFEGIIKPAKLCPEFVEAVFADKQAKFSFYQQLNRLQTEFISPPINQQLAAEERSGAKVLEDFDDKPLIESTLGLVVNNHYSLSTAAMLASLDTSEHLSSIEQKKFAKKMQKLPRVVAYTFMGTDLGPEELQRRNGLCSLKGDYDLNQYYHEGTPAKFRSTSRSPLMAKRFASVHLHDKSPRDGWVYVILAIGGFKDPEYREKLAVLDIATMPTSEKNNRIDKNYDNELVMSLYAEQEVAIPLGFNWKNIVGYRRVLADGKFSGEMFVREGLALLDPLAYQQIVAYLSGKN